MSRFDEQPLPTSTEKSSGSGGGFFSKITSLGQSGGFSAASADAQGTPSAMDLARKEAELANLEANLQRREQDISQQEAQHGVEFKNFPPFWPLIHHDIRNDIPDERKVMMWPAFYSWMGIMVCLLFNWIGAIASWIAGTFDFTTGIGNFFLSLIYLLCGVPLSYFLWYRPLYIALKKQGAFVSYTMFFISYSVHIGFCIFATIAPPFLWRGYSFTGFMSGFSILTNNWIIIGIIYLVGASLFAAETLLSIYVIGRVFAYWRGKK